MSGRKLDPVWASFTRTNEENRVRAICKTCGKDMQPLVARMKKHLENDCSKNLEDNNNGQPDSSVASKSTSKKKNQSQMSTYVIKTSDDLKLQLDEQIARYIYATNSAFVSVEHDEFKTIIEMLRPGYKPPNRQQIGGALLNSIYEKEVKKCAEILKGEIVCLSFDGWSNIHNAPIICACVTTLKGDVYLVDTIDTSGNPHTGEYLAKVMLNTIRKVQAKFSCLVGSVVTDGAANMNSMKEILLDLLNSSEGQNDIENADTEALSMTNENQFQNSEIFENLIACYCSAHGLNLLAQDFEILNVSNHVVRVVKYFRNTHFARAKFQEMKSADSKNLSVPIEIRWNTMNDCLQNYLDNWATIADICDRFPNDIDRDIKKIVLNMGIKQNAADLLNLLKPIAIALDKVQAVSCKISDAVFIWKKLETTLKNTGMLTSERTKMFKKRYAQVLKPVHFLAFLATPLYSHAQEEETKISLTPSEKNSAVEYLEENFENDGLDFLPVLLKFSIGAHPFQGSLMRKETIKKMSALEWWSSVQEIKGIVEKEHLNILHRLMSVSASSADIERIFSTFSLVHSKLRNALGIEKAGKLVFLFKVLNSKK